MNSTSRLQQAVRADDDVDACRRASARSTSRCCAGGLEARQHLDAHRIALAAPAEGVEVLLGEHRGRHQHRHLPPVHDGQERGAQRDLGLAVADVAADQPVHRLAALHVGEHVVDRLLLVGRLLEREGRLELAEVGVGCAVGAALVDLARGATTGGGWRAPTQGRRSVAERYRLHSEPVAIFLDPQLVQLVSRLGGELVKPSYLYFACIRLARSYPGTWTACSASSASRCRSTTVPIPDGPCGWPLFLESPTVPVASPPPDLGLGDAVFYRGRQLAHYRDRLPDGHESSSLSSTTFAKTSPPTRSSSC